VDETHQLAIFLREGYSILVNSGSAIAQPRMYTLIFTKPLQGNLFRKHRDFITNIDPAYYDTDHRSAMNSDGQTGDETLGGQTADDDFADSTPYRTALLTA
jgi:hypothetical protein